MSAGERPVGRSLFRLHPVRLGYLRNKHRSLSPRADLRWCRAVRPKGHNTDGQQTSLAAVNIEKGNMADRSSRRTFIRSAAAAGAALGATGGSTLSAQQAGRIRGFDHVALPMANTDAMLAFYRALGCDVVETAVACSVYFGDNMINFHRPAHWQDKTFTLRAPAAVPPCGDLCFVWEGTADSLKAMLDRAAAKIEVGPASRPGGAPEDGFQCLCARSRRKSSRIHDLPLTGTPVARTANHHTGGGIEGKQALTCYPWRKRGKHVPIHAQSVHA